MSWHACHAGAEADSPDACAVPLTQGRPTAGEAQSAALQDLERSMLSAAPSSACCPLSQAHAPRHPPARVLHATIQALDHD
jgi:hypothetical protein